MTRRFQALEGRNSTDLLDLLERIGVELLRLCRAPKNIACAKRCVDPAVRYDWLRDHRLAMPPFQGCTSGSNPLLGLRQCGPSGSTGTSVDEERGTDSSTQGHRIG